MKEMVTLYGKWGKWVNGDALWVGKVGEGWGQFTETIAGK